jgi:hypothetical protein
MKVIKSISLLLLFISFVFQAHSQNVVQNKKQKGKLYISWGYNKDWHSKSDLHFHSKSNNDYDFTVYNVKAVDRPNFDKLFNEDISIPQFIYRVGYTFAKHPNMGIEIGFDHAKYIMVQDQVAHIKGKIYEKNVDQDTILTRDLLRFEHTNGANFLMLSFVWKNLICQSKQGASELYFALKPGAGIVIPQSEVFLFGVDQNNNYHIAGYVTGLDMQLHYEYKKHLLVETGFKGVFANYLDVLSIADSRANHHFFCLEWLISIGYQFSL